MSKHFLMLAIHWSLYMIMYDDNVMPAPARRSSHHMVVPFDHMIRRYREHIVCWIVDQQFQEESGLSHRGFIDVNRRSDSKLISILRKQSSKTKKPRKRLTLALIHLPVQM